MEPSVPRPAFPEESMVSLSERDTITDQAKSDAEMRPIYSFVFGDTYDFAASSHYSHAALLRTIAERDKSGFTDQIQEFKQRRTSQASGWYGDDSLIFLLLVGCERFSTESHFLDAILTARDRNTNPIPKRVNEVFRALQRKEYGMEGQLSFMKIPFLELSGHLKLSINAAEKGYAELTRPGLLKDLSPFL
ncbi:MAG: hypothetical protein JWM68_1384 [Verrucomicrobiales bacterium]|nr:hypothetical protein [Verrucomicrobiales bacterium]